MSTELFGHATVNEDRLAELAVVLANRVRTEDPDDNGDWLLAETTEQERWHLLFALAAVAPTTEEGYRRAKRWVATPPAEFIDEIAVERACRGERIPLNRLERVAAIKRLTDQGRSTTNIAQTLGLYRRLVQRVRSGEVQFARDVA